MLMRVANRNAINRQFLICLVASFDLGLSALLVPGGHTRGLTYFQTQTLPFLSFNKGRPGLDRFSFPGTDSAV